MNNWHLLFSTVLYTEAAILKGRLENNSIPVQLLNRQDSMYNIAMGEYQIYVPVQFSALAASLLNGTLNQ